jgi:hypothetical protein
MPVKKTDLSDSPPTALPTKDRSADIEPAIRSEEDLERVTSDQKPTAPHGLSEEAHPQIEPKLHPKKAA